MKMKRNGKAELVDDLQAAIAEAKGIYITDFQGMSVAHATELRVRCRAAGVRFQVVKNTLAKRAFAGKAEGDLDSMLCGPTAVALSDADEIVAAKVIADFLKEFERPAFKGGVVDGKVVTAAQAVTLASLPSKDVLLGRLAGGLKSPIQKLHGAFSSPLRSLAAVLKQVAEQKA